MLSVIPKVLGNFSQEMNNTLQSALSGSTETYNIQFKKKKTSFPTPLCREEVKIWG